MHLQEVLYTENYEIHTINTGVDSLWNKPLQLVWS